MGGESGDKVERRELTCPHCHRAFEAELMAGAGGRQRGFKCPHCRLFVPADRAEDRQPVEPAG